MILIINQYIRLLKERNELDALLPLILMSMGMTILTKPQTGTRQYGVDLAAIGHDPETKDNSLFLFIIKQKDIGRAEWDSTPQSVRPSLNEICDVYIPKYIPKRYKNFPIKIIICTSGDLKEEINTNWSGYIDQAKHDISFWGADVLSKLVLDYLLNENLFLNKHKSKLRKTLSLISDCDYTLNDYYSIIQNELSLNTNGVINAKSKRTKDFEFILVRINIILNIIKEWGKDEGNLKQPLKAAERTVLWCWYFICCKNFENNKKIMSLFMTIVYTYINISIDYMEKVYSNCTTLHGASLYSNESALISLVIYEQISFLSILGIILINFKFESNDDIFNKLLNTLNGIILCNPSSSSPRLDNNCIDITLVLFLLYKTNQHQVAIKWLQEIIDKLIFSLFRKKDIPISTDSIEDLASLQYNQLEDYELKRLYSSSWMIPELAGWCVIFKMERKYSELSLAVKKTCADTTLQHCHLTSDSFPKGYFSPPQDSCEAQAPIRLPESMEEFRKLMLKFLESERHNVFSFSPALKGHLFFIDFLMCKHFRCPIPPAIWYRLAMNQ